LKFIFFILQKYPVHDLNLNCISKNPNLTIIFFHMIAYGIDDDWKETWTTCPIDGREKCICQPQMWIPKDLNDNVKKLSLSYDFNVVASATMMRLKLAETSFKAWLHTQGVTISLFMGILFFIVCFN
jgi:hypothetical protein